MFRFSTAHWCKRSVGADSGKWAQKFGLHEHTLKMGTDWPLMAMVRSLTLRGRPPAVSSRLILEILDYIGPFARSHGEIHFSAGLQVGEQAIERPLLPYKVRFFQRIRVSKTAHAAGNGAENYRAAGAFAAEDPFIEVVRPCSSAQRRSRLSSFA